MDAPQRIEKDTYQGRQTTAKGRKHRIAVWTAAELAKLAREGVIFESFGRVNGVEMFGRTHYVADASGALHCYDSEGAKKCIHPSDRKLRILVA